MTTAEKKSRFIQLRAEGQTFSQIAAELSISKATCCRWSKEFKQEIAAREAETLGELFREYKATHAARIKRIGETLCKLDAEIKKRDFAELPLDRLLCHELKYLELLKTEYQPTPDRQALPDKLTTETVLEALKDLLQVSRAGEITDEQAERETKILAAAIRATQGADDEAKTDSINIIVKPATETDFEKEVAKARNGITFVEDLQEDPQE